MDLSQSKLLRQEWESIEVPVEPKEKQILKLMMEGYKNVSLSVNYKQSLFSVIKMEKTPEIAYYLYKKYFEKLVMDQVNKSSVKMNFVIKNGFSDSNLKRLKSADLIRLQNVDTKVNTDQIVEYPLIDMCEQIITNKGSINNSVMYLYTLLQIKKTSILHINEYVMQYVDYVISIFYNKIDVEHIVYNAPTIIEQNPYLFQYEDIQLYTHQKQFYSIFRNNTDESKMVLYSAPTGTGKTITPIGLLDDYKVIFVCVARHIGLSLAKAAISVERKVAFAFGCSTASDIRLHYYAAANYTKNKKSGGIGKVDNSDGSKVELMICDVESYITAMHYMISFNSDLHKIITYWDEPTITLDYERHELHETIHRNWSKNKIPNMVFSCATLPKEEEIMSVIEDFREKFDHVRVYNIVSFDCKKSIPILNKDGKCVLPHVFYSEYNDMMNCVDHCMQNQTLLRYFDLSEIKQFIQYVNDNKLVNNEDYMLSNYFNGVPFEEITMHSIKYYYLLLLRNINKSMWGVIHEYMKTTQKSRFQTNRIQKMKSDSSKYTQSNAAGEKLSRSNSVSMCAGSGGSVATTPNTSTKQTNPSSQGILITTADAYTLTDGPTIFLTEDVKKIGTFYVQQSSIPSNVFQNILIKISRNNEIVSKITLLERDLEEKQKTFDDTSKAHKASALVSNSKAEKGSGTSGGGGGAESARFSKESEVLLEQINYLRSEIMSVTLDSIYIPNTRQHQEFWAPGGAIYKNAFVSSIDEETTKTIMGLEIDNNLKVLLMLGIGMFLEKANVSYMEIMKRLATEQRLFIIIASSDYIYGTNYNFTHGFIGKDLMNMTQNKIMQCLGRIGRNRIQQEYSARFRDDGMIRLLFEPVSANIEAKNMCALFVTDADDR